MSIVKTVLDLRVRQGANLTQLPDWTGNPLYAFSNSVIHLVAGNNCKIYGESLVNLPVPVPVQFAIEYTCDIGSQSGNDYTINPTSNNIGTHTLTIVTKYSGKILNTYTVNLFVYAAPIVQIGTVNVLFVGDSLTQLGIDYFQTKLNALVSNCTINFTGTQGTTVKHEGRGGWKWYDFVRSGSPFFKSSAINVPAYFTDNSIAVPKLVHFMLDVNDCYGYSTIAGGGITEAQITTILADAKLLIDAFLAYNANLKIVITIPTISEDTGAGWNANYDESVYSQNIYVENIHKMWIAVVNAYENYAYSSRVVISYAPIFLDRNNGYPKIDGIHSNALHLASIGYQELAAGFYNGINKALNKCLTDNLIPSASSDFTTDGTAFWSTRGGSTTKAWNASGYMTISSPSVSGFVSGIVVWSIFKLSAKYRFSFSVRSSNYTGGMVVQLGGVNVFVYPAVTSSWQVLTGFGTMSATINNFSILCADAFNGSIDIDNIIIQEVEGF